MNLNHSQRFAGRLARQAVGDFYPGPRLMPHSVLRAMDPLFALAFDAIPKGGEQLTNSLNDMLLGRPDGPLMLASWCSVRGGEIPHCDIRQLAQLLNKPWPNQPQNRGELMAWLLPRASITGKCFLSVAGRRSDEAIIPAERFGMGLALTWVLCKLPEFIRDDKFPLPISDLKKAGLTLDELKLGVRTPAIDRFLATEARWANELLNEGLTLRNHLGARLRRGLRAAIVRSRLLLDQVEDPQLDIFRTPPKLNAATRYYSAWRGLMGVKPRP